MEELKKSLTNLGFSEKKAQVYLALLELAEASVIDLAKKTGFKRTTVYNIIPELMQEGLIKTGIKNKHRFFFIENPINLKREFEEKSKTVDQLLPELRAIQNVIPHKPKIIFYEGLGGMKELYQDTLDSLSGGDTILSYTGFRDYYKFMPRKFMDDYVAERVKKKIRIRMIVPESETAKEVKEREIEDLRQVKIVSDPKFLFSADTEIYANKVALISHTENFMGVIIESKEINQMQRMAFDLMWNSIK